MKGGKREIPSSEHEEVYHAASRYQAASLSLTSRRLHGLVKACSVEGKKQAVLPLSTTNVLSRRSHCNHAARCA